MIFLFYDLLFFFVYIVYYIFTYSFPWMFYHIFIYFYWPFLCTSHLSVLFNLSFYLAILFSLFSPKNGNTSSLTLTKCDKILSKGLAIFLKLFYCAIRIFVSDIKLIFIKYFITHNHNILSYCACTY